jgi:hypothetical protein
MGNRTQLLTNSKISSEQSEWRTDREILRALVSVVVRTRSFLFGRNLGWLSSRSGDESSRCYTNQYKSSYEWHFTMRLFVSRGLAVFWWNPQHGEAHHNYLWKFCACLCLINHAMNTPGQWRCSSNILDLDTILRRLVSLMPRSFYPRGRNPQLPLDRSLEWADLDAIENILFALPEVEPRTPRT